MCTAICYQGLDNYFGRNLDLDKSYGEGIVFTPRNFKLFFKKTESINTHYAILGMGIVVNDYPLYFDAINEKGLGMSGLNFPENAYFHPEDKNKTNIAPFEFIPWILGNCQTITEAKDLLTTTNLLAVDFSEAFPSAPLHWMISDGNDSIVIESTKQGIRIFDNPVGVLTNSPSFDYQLFNLNNYRFLSPKTTEPSFSNKVDFTSYCTGLGGLGLPGDASSMSRFVKAAFVKLNSPVATSETASISQFFHILKAVEQPKGMNELGQHQFEYTVYSSCCNLSKGIYYYTTYDNSQITAVSLQNENLDGNVLTQRPLVKTQQINYDNC